MTPVARLIILCGALVGCDSSSGDDPNYKLMKQTIAGPAEVGLIFGFVDDREFCIEIAEMYNRRYKAANLYCEKE